MIRFFLELKAKSVEDDINISFPKLMEGGNVEIKKFEPSEKDAIAVVTLIDGK